MNDINQAADPDRSAAVTGPLQDWSTLQLELRGLIHDQLQLATLEFRQAAHSLMNLVSVALAISILLVMAWGGLMAAAVLGLLGTGLQPSWALLLVSTLTALLAVLLARNIRYWSRDLGFPASLRALMPASNDAIHGKTND